MEEEESIKDTGSTVITTRSVLDKGFVLKRRCGQIRVRENYLHVYLSLSVDAIVFLQPKELYLHPEPILTLGYSTLSVSDLKSVLKSSRRSGCDPPTVFVPTQKCLLKYSKVILEASVHTTSSGIRMLFLQSVLR